MDVVIWHNPKCSTSRRVLDAIRAHGVEPTIIEYLKTPPSVAEIKSALKTAGLSPRDLLRRRGAPLDALGLDEAATSEAELIKAMHEHPELIERPVVRTRKGVRLCRPPERLDDIL